MSFCCPDEYRMKGHPTWGTTRDMDGDNGLFIIPMGKSLRAMCIASDGMGWQHVSISLKNAGKGGKLHPIERTPTWAEMCIIKGLFWGDDDVVVQFHPAKENHVSFHDYCLHLWKPTLMTMPAPPAILVGPQD